MSPHQQFLVSKEKKGFKVTRVSEQWHGHREQRRGGRKKCGGWMDRCGPQTWLVRNAIVQREQPHDNRKHPLPREVFIQQQWEEEEGEEGRTSLAPDRDHRHYLHPPLKSAKYEAHGEDKF